MPPGRWNEYRELVLRELDRLQKWCEKLTGENAQLSKELEALKRDVSGIKIRVAMYSVLGGGVISAILWAIKVFVLDG